jgi:hypothetical protein
MSRGRCKFTQADVTKAVKGAIAADVQVAGVEVDAGGRIRIIVGKPANVPNGHANEWDIVYEPTFT